eukprot:CAMPEP_0185781606 /NCGR_PEP_ID=MMETSP1174-20130828/102982_1 /TAXON_ID=35687 /ORGANISM="Dictyocha speculum, Strain CCMP1381" /LENGTH=791 /DNA_ID=CAMNT_0028471655 /DNA_START=143 /DNA_END=2515 /DNA_ORIENTATION=-
MYGFPGYQEDGQDLGNFQDAIGLDFLADLDGDDEPVNQSSMRDDEKPIPSLNSMDMVPQPVPLVTTYDSSRSLVHKCRSFPAASSEVKEAITSTKSYSRLYDFGHEAEGTDSLNVSNTLHPLKRHAPARGPEDRFYSPDGETFARGLEGNHPQHGLRKVASTPELPVQTGRDVVQSNYSGQLQHGMAAFYAQPMFSMANSTPPTVVQAEESQTRPRFVQEGQQQVQQQGGQQQSVLSINAVEVTSHNIPPQLAPTGGSPVAGELPNNVSWPDFSKMHMGPGKSPQQQPLQQGQQQQTLQQHPHHPQQQPQQQPQQPQHNFYNMATSQGINAVTPSAVQGWGSMTPTQPHLTTTPPSDVHMARGMISSMAAPGGSVASNIGMGGVGVSIGSSGSAPASSTQGKMQPPMKQSPKMQDGKKPPKSARVLAGGVGSVGLTALNSLNLSKNTGLGLNAVQLGLGGLGAGLNQEANLAAARSMSFPAQLYNLNNMQQHPPAIARPVSGSAATPGPASGLTPMPVDQGNMLRNIISCPDFFSLCQRMHTEDERRRKRLARNRASARLRREKRKSLVETSEQELAQLEAAMAKLREHRWGKGQPVNELQECLEATTQSLEHFTGLQLSTSHESARRILWQQRDALTSSRMEHLGTLATRVAAALPPSSQQFGLNDDAMDVGAAGDDGAQEGGGGADSDQTADLRELATRLHLDPEQRNAAQAAVGGGSHGDEVISDLSLDFLILDKCIESLHHQLWGQFPTLDGVIEAWRTMLTPQQLNKYLNWVDMNRETVAALELER